METKICNKCNVKKDIVEFGLSKGYLLNSCKKFGSDVSPLFKKAAV